MTDPYERVKGGRLAFKGGDLATRKSIEKKKKKHKKNKEKLVGADGGSHEEAVIIPTDGSATSSAAAGNDIYAIDAAQKKKYDELFPVEAKKFGYVPKSNFDSVKEALDDRVKKKADRYCK